LRNKQLALVIVSAACKTSESGETKTFIKLSKHVFASSNCVPTENQQEAETRQLQIIVPRSSWKKCFFLYVAKIRKEQTQRTRHSTIYHRFSLKIISTGSESRFD
jgi:hypothetical protein